MSQQPTPRKDTASIENARCKDVQIAGLTNDLMSVRDSLKAELADAQAQILALREALEFTLKTPHAHHCACVKCEKAKAALSSPPPPVVSLEEHEKVVKDAENLALELGEVASQLCNCAHPACRNCERVKDAKAALAAHEARKGAAV